MCKNPKWDFYQLVEINVHNFNQITYKSIIPFLVLRKSKRNKSQFERNSPLVGLVFSFNFILENCKQAHMVIMGEDWAKNGQNLAIRVSQNDNI